MLTKPIHEIDARNPAAPSICYFLRFRVTGRVNYNDSARNCIHRATYEVFGRDMTPIDADPLTYQAGDVQEGPCMTLTLDLDTNEYTVRQLDASMPAENALAVIKQLSADYIRSDAIDLADEYDPSDFESVDVNENGLLIYCSDFDFDML